MRSIAACAENLTSENAVRLQHKSTAADSSAGAAPAAPAPADDAATHTAAKADDAATHTVTKADEAT